MFRKFKGLFTLLAILCVSAVAGGSAYFYFGGEESEERSIDNNVETSGDNNTSISADNILENYEFGKPDLNETYTYYFFPSTLYMELYKNGQNPETVFGYNEVVLDDSGDPALTSDGQPMYNIVTEDIKGVKDTSYNTYYQYLVNSLNNNPDYYLSNGDKASRDYPITTREVYSDSSDALTSYTYYYGHDYFVDPYVINNPGLKKYLDNEDQYNNSEFYSSEPNAEGTTQWLASHHHYLYFYLFKGTSNVDVKAEHWGGINNVDDVRKGISPGYTGTFSKSSEVLSPKADVKIGANDIYGINRKLDETSAETYIDSEVDKTLDRNKYREQMVEKAQYRNDRFGFWAPFYDWDDKNNADSALKTEYSASRYLPIKITVNGNLTPDDMAKIIPTVESSMFDSHLYFDFTANGWTYVKKSGSELKDSELEYQSAVGGFTAKDLDYIFDIMQNPSKYASVENGENVIRLFPVFSNGKNYKSKEGESIPADEGGGDALKAKFLYTDDAKSTIKNDALVSETKLNYDSLKYSYTYTHKPIEVQVEGPYEGYAFSGTLNEYTPAEGDSSETTPEIFYGTWTGVLGEMNTTIVINEDNTGSYNDMTFTYNVQGNKILGTTDDGYKITIICIPQTVSYDVNYGVLKTVELKKGKYEQISFNIEPASEASANWQGNWIQTHVLTGSAIDSFISKYGEGLYTFYYIIGNRMRSTDLGSSLSSIGWNSNLISFLTNNTDPKNNLRNKTLLTINQPTDASTINVNKGDSYKFAYNDYPNIIIGERSRPVVLAVEKVTNLRLVTDIPIKEYDDGTGSYNDTLFTYVDNGEKIVATAEDGSFTLNIIYDETSQSLDFTYDDGKTQVKGTLTEFVPAQSEETPEAPAYIGTWTGKVGQDTITLVLNGNGTPTDDQDWDAIDKNIEQGLNNAQNAIIADEVYEIGSYTDEISDTDLIEANRLDDDNPYIYLIQNADFRFVNNLYFQIRFSNDYISGGMNVRTEYPGDGADVPKYVAYKANGQIMKFFYQNSNEGIFIDNVGPIKGEGTVVDDNDQEKKDEIERSGFKLTNYNARGIYDILLVSTGFDVATGTQNFDMYINRHKNNFIKLFQGNPGVFDYQVDIGETVENDKFVAHKLPNEVDADEADQVRADTSSLIWNGQTYLGEYLATSTTGTGYGDKVDEIEKVISEKETFIDSIKRTLGVTPGKDTIYPIIDAVTNKTIAYYNAGIGRLFTAYGSTDGLNDNLDLFTTMKNYVLYIGDPIKSSL